MLSDEQYKAKCFIISGYFPKNYEYIALQNLRDKFMTLGKEFLSYLLTDEETKDNALALFKMMFADVYIEELIRG